jgi:hypothetical protein
MLQEAMLVPVSALAQVCAPSFLPEVHQREESTTAVVAANPGLDVSLAQSAAAVTAEPEEALQSFIKETAVPATRPILQTPAKNTTAAKGADEPFVRRSGRLAAKTQNRGRKSSEELAQEILCEKLEGVPGQQGKVDKARERLMKFFDTPLPQDTMEAIEDLVKVISLEGKPGSTPAKAGKKAPKA